MKKTFWKLLLLFGLTAAIYWFARPSAPGTSETPAAPPSAPQAVKPPQKAATVTAPAASAPITSPAQVQALLTPAQPGTFKRIEAPLPPPVKIPGGYAATTQPDPAREEAEEVALNLRNFSQRFGGNPVGTNAEITKALNGGNAAAANYLPASRRTNAGGELLDIWGTPYFFHQMSASHMEVRSAGPDKMLWTSDDIVVQ